MTFPVLEATIQGYRPNGSGNPVSIPLPASVAAGELLLVFISLNTWDHGTDPTWGSGFTLLASKNSGGFENCFGGVGYKVAAGGETSVSITSHGDAMAGCHYQCHRVSHYAGLPEAVTAVGGFSVNPDPPLLTPSWGVDDVMWFATCHAESGGASATAYPTGYSNGYTNANEYTSFSIARKTATAASDDPSVFTVLAGPRWAAITTAVRGGAGGGGGGGGGGARSSIVIT